MSSISSSVPLRILIADHQSLVRSAIRLLLETRAGFEVVAETADGEGTLEEVAATQPHVALVDVAIPAMDGIEITRRIRVLAPETRVLALTAVEAERVVRAALAAGAAGYVPKAAGAEELIDAIRAVARGENYVHPRVAAALEKPSKSSFDLADLTSRETQVIRLMGLGYSHKEAAAQLTVSVKTIETHKRRAMQKLGVRNRADMVRLAAEYGWIPPIDGGATVPV